MMSRQSGDADWPRRLTTGGIRQRGTAELSIVADSEGGLAGSAPPPLADGLTPSLTVVL